jgi:hypothetical protein
MSFTQRVFTSYQPYADGNTRIGELYRIWYDSITHTLRIQLDPTTPGGTIIAGGGAVSGPAQGITFVGDDSTGTRISDGETLKVTGTGGITTSMSGDVLTINGNIPTTLNSLTDVLLTDPVNGQVLKYDSNIGQWVNAADLTSSGEGISLTDLSVSQQPATATGSLTYNNITGVFAYAPSIGTITVVGDDSSGTIFNVGETIKIAGTQNITTAVSGDTLTITGPNLTPYLTNSTITVVGDDSTGTTLNTGETIKIAGTSGISTAVSGDILTITGTLYSSNFYYGAFHSDNQTTLTADINSNSTSPLAVASTAGFPSSGGLLIGTEMLSYTGKTASTFTGITRGVQGSSGATHDNGDYVSVAQVGAALTPQTVLLDVTDLSNGVTLNTATSEITIVHAGVYNIMFSIQTACSDNSPDDIIIWFNLNGNPIPSTASHITTPAIHANVPGSTIVAANIFYTFAAGDKVTLKWCSISGKSGIATYPSPVAGIPISPGVIVTVNQIA